MNGCSQKLSKMQTPDSLALIFNAHGDRCASSTPIRQTRPPEIRLESDDWRPHSTGSRFQIATVIRLAMNSEFDYVETKPPLSAMGRVVESIGIDTDSQGKCRVCSGKITDRYMSRIDSKVYHESCVRCCVCDVQLQEKCYEKDGQLYCSTHYYKDCSPYRCSGCKLGISPTDMVYKLKVSQLF
ncbi:LIM domain protein [Oesophagostomum dentatum]|uniref:LIM domain protein n=1 Tax=Oesophagostomum dentatum TaxID=61180 RepID=A0A0B1S1V1_OESDE|nr:LIM domain protein [Oesophagostomum dentatum]